MLQFFSATIPATPVRIAGITVKDSASRPILRRRRAADPAAVLWRALDLCAVSARCLRKGSHSNEIPIALVVIDVAFADGNHANTSIIKPLTTEYPALLRSLRVLRIARNDYDESAALGAFAALTMQLRELTFWNCGLTSVRGLEGRCEYLQKVSLAGCSHVCTLEGLGDRLYLEDVNARWTGITSVKPLRTCPHLTKADLSGCQQLSSMEAFENHLWLQEIDAPGTAISSIEPLRTCPSLTKVNLSCRHLTSMEALANHQWLQEVNVSCTGITSIEPLRTCPALRRVVLFSCRLISSIEALSDHLYLQVVDASHTAVTSIEPLRRCPALKTIHF